MHPQRNAVTVAASIGLLTTCLPWLRVHVDKIGDADVEGTYAAVQSVSGIALDGRYSALLFISAILAVAIRRRPQRLTIGERLTVAGMALVAGGFALLELSRVMPAFAALGLFHEIPHVGVLASIVASVALIAVVVLYWGGGPSRTPAAPDAAAPRTHEPAPPDAAAPQPREQA